MRITQGTIYLAQPVFGRRRLSGAATIGTTRLDYTFTDADRADAADPPPGAETDVLAPTGWRVLIPITNVIAVVLGPDDTASDRGSGLP
jgi:hypothetical protein